MDYGNNVRGYVQAGAGAASFFGGGSMATSAGFDGAALFAVPSSAPTAPGAGGAGASNNGTAPGFANSTAGAPGGIVIFEYS